MKIELRNEPLKEVRADNMIPGVIYGKRIDSTPVKVDYKEFMKNYYQHGKSMTFKIKLDGKSHQVYIKDVQLDPLNQRNVVHFDLIKVTATSTITADIPVHLINKDTVEAKGYVVQQIANAVHTEYGVGKGINNFQVDVEGLEQGDALYIKDLNVPEGIKILDDPEKMIVNVTMPTIEEEPEDDEDEEVVEVEAIKQKDEAPSEEKE
ncbi:50S ribosomal protein L25 [Liberiplasma polymorphum]|jgi:large subunit ribosomal protein L25|uniref:50S ribosomal protein L25 n=1 Tax=Liberiplasma polymorphum TaxID=3374570 RepID=UPI003772F2D2